MALWFAAAHIVAETVLVAWLVLFALLIAYRLIIGTILLSGALTMDGTQFSPERAQVLLLTLGGGAAYAVAALQMGRFPDLPDSVVVVLAASHGVYLAGKTNGR
jgi:hypothetical protein